MPYALSKAQLDAAIQCIIFSSFPAPTPPIPIATLISTPIPPLTSRFPFSLLLLLSLCLPLFFLLSTTHSKPSIMAPLRSQWRQRTLRRIARLQARRRDFSVVPPLQAIRCTAAMRRGHGVAGARAPRRALLVVVLRRRAAATLWLGGEVPGVDVVSCSGCGHVRRRRVGGHLASTVKSGRKEAARYVQGRLQTKKE